jgi:hypothetical protein
MGNARPVSLAAFCCKSILHHLSCRLAKVPESFVCGLYVDVFIKLLLYLFDFLHIIYKCIYAILVEQFAGKLVQCCNGLISLVTV